MVHAFDGAEYGQNSILRLGKARIDSALNELRCMLADPDFFAPPEPGINCQSGFIMVDADGEAVLLEHSPDHRQRHTLPGRSSEGAEKPEGHERHHDDQELGQAAVEDRHAIGRQRTQSRASGSPGGRVITLRSAGSIGGCIAVAT
jgi:hypothetical protein